MHAPQIDPERRPAVHSRSLFLAAAIATLLLLPAPPPSIAPGWASALPLDKVVHFALFLIAARPWHRSMSQLGFARPGLATLIFATTYAGLIELLQGAFSSTHVADFWDLVAGSLGALAGLLAFRER